MTDIAPLGFSVETKSLEDGAKAAQEAAKAFRDVGHASDEGSKKTSDAAKSHADAAKAMREQAEAAKALKAANEGIARSANEAAAAQGKLTQQRFDQIAAMPTGARQKLHADELGMFYQQRQDSGYVTPSGFRTPVTFASAPPGGPPIIPPTATGGAGMADVAAGATAVSRVGTAAAGSAAGIGILAAAAGALGAVFGMVVVKGVSAATQEMIRMSDEALLLERRLDSIGQKGATLAATDIGFDARIGSSAAEAGITSLLEARPGAAVTSRASDITRAFGASYVLGGGEQKGAAGFLSGVAGMASDGRIDRGELATLDKQSPETVNQIAASLKVSREELERMAANGQLLSDEIFVRMAERAGDISDKLADQPMTFTEAMGGIGGALKDSLARAVGAENWADIWTPLAKGLIERLRQEGDQQRANGGGGLTQTAAAVGAALFPMATPFLLPSLINGESAAGPTQEPTVRATEGAFSRGVTPVGQGGYGVTSPQGRRVRDGVTGWHWGIDMAAPAGTPVYSPSAGRVTRVDENKRSGKFVEVLGDDGITRQFLHFSNQTVKRNDIVERGSKIGEVGSTGDSTGDHLDYRAKGPDGKFLDAKADLEGLARRYGPGTATAPTATATATAPAPTAALSVGQGEIQALIADLPSASIAKLRTDIDRIQLALQQPVTAAQRRELNEALARKQAQLRSASETSGQRNTRAEQDLVAGGGPGGASIRSAARSASESSASIATGLSDDARFEVELGEQIRSRATRMTTDAASIQRQADDSRASAKAAAQGPVAQETAQIEAEVAAMAYREFGSYADDDRAKAAIEQITKALKDRAAATRALSNETALFNAKQDEMVSTIRQLEQAAGLRGEALERSVFAAEMGVLRAAGGPVEARTKEFETRIADDRSRRIAAQDDLRMRAERRLAVTGTDPYSVRQFERGEEVRQAEIDRVGTGDSVRRRQAAEDAVLARERLESDENRIRLMREEQSLGLLVGRERREQEAVLRRQQELVAQGMLPAGQALTATEQARVVALQEATEEYSKQMARVADIQAIGPGLGASVGSGLRQAFQEAFDDGEIRGRDLMKVLTSTASSMAMTVVDAMFIKPIERMATSFAEDKIVPFLTNLLPGMGGEAGGSATKAGEASAGGHAIARATDAKNVASATALGGAQTKLTATTTAASSSLAAMTQAANAAAKALMSVAGTSGGASGGAGAVASFASSFIANLGFGGGAHGGGSASGGGGMTPSNLSRSAFGNAFSGGMIIPYAMGGVKGSPFYFPMANGAMGMGGEAGEEAILPLRRGPDGRLGVAGGGGGGGGGDVQIIVNDMRSDSKAPAVETESRNVNGKRMIRMTIRDEMKSAIRDGAMDGPLNSTYGTPRQIVRR